MNATLCPLIWHQLLLFSIKLYVLAVAELTLLSVFCCIPVIGYKMCDAGGGGSCREVGRLGD